MTTTLGPACCERKSLTTGGNGGGGRAGSGSLTFSETSLIAPDLTRTVSGWVITPGDTSWDEARRPCNLRMDQHLAVFDAAGLADIAAAVRYGSRCAENGPTLLLVNVLLLRVAPVTTDSAAGAAVRTVTPATPNNGQQA
jgi:hypothetical protein